MILKNRTLTLFAFATFSEIYFKVFAIDVCLTPNVIDDWKRSVNNTDMTEKICDVAMIDQWYRIKSKAGERMPTECPVGGYRCGTTQPFWLTNITVAKNEEIFPMVNKNVTRIACSSHFSEDCCRYNVTIEIKNCTDYLVYRLKPTPACPSGYCFGTELPCPPGENSENGFSPGCGDYPTEILNPKPTVTTGLHSKLSTNQRVMTERVKFVCNANIDATKNYTFDVRWYINKDEIGNAFYKNVSLGELTNSVLHQEHWEKTHKPNMNVSCSIQLRNPSFPSPGKRQYSDDFFAAIIIDFRDEHKILKEGEPPKKIKARLTIPVGCSYPMSDAIIGQGDCVVNLIGAVPDYQEKGKCNHDAAEGLTFSADQCGINFNFTHWKDPQTIIVSGKSDEKINVRPRSMSLRMYVDAQFGSDNVNLNFWNGFMLPDLKFSIHDSDYETLGDRCSSDNDPHMTTFDRKRYDFHKTEGEYIMYKNLELPVEIHSYYQKCDYYIQSNGGALCNCGAAVRSGDSVFIANFCNIGNRQNQYAINEICDDQDMFVEAKGNSYTIHTMTGTKVFLVFGEVTQPSQDFYGIQTFQITASPLDVKLTTGLCGTYNKNPYDDMIPQGETTSIGNGEIFAESWRIKNQTESLMNIDKIKPVPKYATAFCTCKKKAELFPWGRPEYVCNFNDSMAECSKLNVTNTVYKAPCKKGHVRTERDTSHIIRQRRDVIDLGDDDAPVMFPMDVKAGRSIPVDLSWKNGWTEQKARKHCEEAFHSSSSYSVCDTHVPSVPSGDYIEKCIGDIRLTGDTSWKDISISNFGSACLQEASRLENLTETNETDSSGNEMSIFDAIQVSTCPKNCTGRGMCIEGECQCNDPYFGPSCEAEKSQAPKLSLRAFDGLCDIRVRLCHKYIITGHNFMNGNLKCKYRHFTIQYNETTDTGISETEAGIYNSPFSMQCPAPISRHKRSLTVDSSAFGYFISVSNDGKNFTQELAVIIYDSVCFECSTTNLTCLELETCPQMTEVVKEKSKSKTGAYIGAGIGGGSVVVILLVIFTIIKKTILKTRSSVKDSTVSLAEKCQSSGNTFFDKSHKS